MKEYLIELPKIEDQRGNLSFIEPHTHIPFDIKRGYWIYDVPGGQIRGSHAFREQDECIIALSGSFDVVIYDGHQEHSYSLNRSYRALYIPRLMWRTMQNFSTNSLALVLSSTTYNPDDYIWEQGLLEALRSKQPSPILPPSGSITTCSKTESVDFRSTSIEDCIVTELPKVHNRQGNLTALNNLIEIPFEIQRCYYLYDIPSGSQRGGHAHYALYQYIIAAQGSFEVMVDDGKHRRTIALNRPDKALLITPGIWRELTNFSSGAICLVLASTAYMEQDYIYDYTNFKKLKGCK